MLYTKNKYIKIIIIKDLYKDLIYIKHFSLDHSISLKDLKMLCLFFTFSGKINLSLLFFRR